MRKSPDLDRQSLGRRHHDSAGNHTFALGHANPRSRSMSHSASTQQIILIGGDSDSAEGGPQAIDLAVGFGEEVERHSCVQRWVISSLSSSKACRSGRSRENCHHTPSSLCPFAKLCGVLIHDVPPVVLLTTRAHSVRGRPDWRPNPSTLQRSSAHQPTSDISDLTRRESLESRLHRYTASGAPAVPNHVQVRPYRQ